jgi:hypothetical protein
MKNLRLLIVCTGILSLLAAQSDPSKQNEAVAMTITPSKAEVKAGEEIRLRIVLTNGTQQDMPNRGIILEQEVDISYKYDCRDASGKSVTKQVSMDGHVSGHEVPGLKAGESRETGISLGQVCDLSQPGQYDIQLSRTEPIGNEQSIRVKSNKITVTVLPYLTMLLTTPNPTVKGGSPLLVNVKITNDSPQELNLGNMDPDTRLDRNSSFAIYSDQGQLQPKAKSNVVPLETKVEIKPGESYAQQEDLSRWYDLNQPGRYVVQLMRPVSENPADGTIRSNRISITVTP